MSSQRIDHLDGLRGIAAVLVLIGHVAESIRENVPTPALDPVLDVAGLGRIGVIAFFCISGFVIPFSFREPDALRNFAISRFFRLYPAYWLSLALFLALMGLLGQSFPLTQIAANLTMAQTGLGQADVADVYWTLFYELVFYLLCMIVFALGWLESARMALWGLFGLCLVASAAAILHFVEAPVKPPLGLGAYLSIMVFGTVCRFAIVGEDPLARRWLGAAAAMIVVMVAAVALLGYWNGGSRPSRPLADFLGVYLGLALFLGAFRAKSVLARPGMIWLGGISYSLYLMHVACVMAAAALAGQFASGSAKVALILAAIPLSLLVAHLSAIYVERPMIKLGKTIIGRGRRAPAYEGLEPAP